MSVTRMRAWGLFRSEGYGRNRNEVRARRAQFITPVRVWVCGRGAGSGGGSATLLKPPSNKTRATGLCGSVCCVRCVAREEPPGRHKNRGKGAVVAQHRVAFVVSRTVERGADTVPTIFTVFPTLSGRRRNTLAKAAAAPPPYHHAEFARLGPAAPLSRGRRFARRRQAGPSHARYTSRRPPAGLLSALRVGASRRALADAGRGGSVLPTPPAQQGGRVVLLVLVGHDHTLFRRFGSVHVSLSLVVDESLEGRAHFYGITFLFLDWLTQQQIFGGFFAVVVVVDAAFPLAFASRVEGVPFKWRSAKSYPIFAPSSSSP